MRNILIAGSLIILSTASVYGAASGTQVKDYTQTNLYQLGKDSSQAGVIVSGPKGSLTEAELLIRLDKEGRDHYRSLSYEGKKRVLELASHTGAWDAIETVERETVQGLLKDQDRMLNNGMNRINGKPQKPSSR